MKVYSLQVNLELGKVDKNIEKIFSFIKDVKKNSLLLLPEMFSSGFDNENLEKHVKITPEIYRKLKDFSKEKNLVISGTLPEKYRGKIYNKAFVIDHGEISYKQSKVKLFRPTNEDAFYTPGKSFDVAESSNGNLGIMICFELRFPNISYTLRRKGVEIILVPAQWGKPRKMHFEVLSRARAIENQCFVITSNTTGKIGDIEYAGSSGIYSPWGEILAFIDGGEGLIEADINLNDIYKVRKLIRMDF